MRIKEEEAGETENSGRYWTDMFFGLIKPAREHCNHSKYGHIYMTYCKLFLPKVSLGRLAESGAQNEKGAEAPFQQSTRMCSDHTENEEPQPQVVVALGFLITNCAPSRSSL